MSHKSPLSLTRRAFLVSAGGMAGLLVVGCEPGKTGVAAFFSEDERLALSAAADRLLPGCAAAGVVDFLEVLLTAFAYDPPRIFAGGPYSGRTPYPDPTTGDPTDQHPPNRFVDFVPLTPELALAWRIRLYGSDMVPGAPNVEVLGPVVGWRQTYREGAQALLDAATQQGAPFDQLDGATQDQVIANLPGSFTDLLLQHAVESYLAAPEYGGNRDLQGWRAIRYDGDSMPLGYSLFDTTTGTYHERPDAPVSTPNPGEDYAGLSADVDAFIGTIVAFAGGTKFTS